LGLRATRYRRAERRHGEELYEFSSSPIFSGGKIKKSEWEKYRFVVRGPFERII